jgi:hypothetical protein
LRLPVLRASYGKLQRVRTDLDHLTNWRDEEQPSKQTPLGWLKQKIRRQSRKESALQRERNELIKSSWHAPESEYASGEGAGLGIVHAGYKPQLEPLAVTPPLLPIYAESPPPICAESPPPYTTDPSSTQRTPSEDNPTSVLGSGGSSNSLVDDHDLILLTRQGVRNDWSMGGWELVRAMFLTSQTERELFGLMGELPEGEEDDEGDEGEKGDDVEQGDVHSGRVSPVQFKATAPRGWGLVRFKLIGARLLSHKTSPARKRLEKSDKRRRLADVVVEAQRRQKERDTLSKE